MALFTRYIRRGRRVTEPQVLALLDRAAQELGVQPAVALVETPCVAGPALIGWLRPRILVPPGFLSSLSSEEIRYAFLHELAHIRRRDPWMNLLISGLSCVHWFNPLVHVFARRMRIDLEAACDATVLRRLSVREGQGYGHSILRVLESMRAVQPQLGVLGMWSDREQVRYRLQRIMSFPAQRPGTVIPAVVSIGLLLIGLTAADSRRTGEFSVGSPSEPTSAGSLSQPQLPESAGPLVAASRPGSLDIRVSRAPGRRDEEAEVTWQLETESGGKQQGKGRPDASGDWVLRLPGEPLRELIVEARADRHWPARCEWKADENSPPNSLMSLSLLRITPVGGRVVDLEGKPLANAVVTLEFLAPETDNPLEPNTRARYRLSQLTDKMEATTAEDGSWMIQRGVPSYAERSWSALRLAVRHPDCVAGFHDWGGLAGDGMQRCSAGQVASGGSKVDGSLSTNMVLRLAKRVSVGGQVLDTQGHALTNAEIELHAWRSWALTTDSSTPPDSLEPLRVVPDSEGRFRVADVAPWVPLFTNSWSPQVAGRLAILNVQAQGLVPQSLDLELPQGVQEPLRIVLKKGVVLKGRVVDVAGQPVGGVSLWAAEGRARAVSRADGAFELGLVPEGVVALTLQRGQFVPDIERTLDTSIAFHTLVVPPQPILEVQIIDSVTGQAVPEFGLVVLSSPHGGRLMELLKVPHHTDLKGNWSLSLSNLSSQISLSRDGNLPEEARVKVEAPGYLPEVSEPFRTQGYSAIRSTARSNAAAVDFLYLHAVLIFGAQDSCLAHS
jgi:hypothetical protein